MDVTSFHRLSRGRGAKIEDAAVVGERSERADIVVTPFPSDHCGVVATVEIEEPPTGRGLICENAATLSSL